MDRCGYATRDTDGGGGNIGDNINVKVCGKKFTLYDKMISIVGKIIKDKEMTRTQPGSIKYLMFGSEPSEQSLSIKMGKVGEEMIKKTDSPQISTVELTTKYS